MLDWKIQFSLLNVGTGNVEGTSPNKWYRLEIPGLTEK